MLTRRGYEIPHLFIEEMERVEKYMREHPHWADEKPALTSLYSWKKSGDRWNLTSNRPPLLFERPALLSSSRFSSYGKRLGGRVRLLSRCILRCWRFRRSGTRALQLDHKEKQDDANKNRCAKRLEDQPAILQPLDVGANQLPPMPLVLQPLLTPDRPVQRVQHLDNLATTRLSYIPAFSVKGCNYDTSAAMTGWFKEYPYLRLTTTVEDRHCRCRASQT
jgi:hypothetical protein